MRVRTPIALVAAASSAAAFLLVVQSPAQTAAPAAAAAAAPFNQAYSTSAHAEVLHLNAVGGLGLPGVADAGVGISEGTTSGVPDHAASAEARNVDLALLGGAPANLLAQAKQTAPPDNAAPTSDTSIPIHLSPLLQLDVSTATAHARTPSATQGCLPASTALSASSVNTAKLTVVEAAPVSGLVSLPGTAKTAQASALVPNALAPAGRRSVVTAVSGSLADVRLLNDQIRVSVAETPTLKATASGMPGGAKVEWDAPLVKVTVGGTPFVLPVDGSPLNIVAPSNPLLHLELQLGQLENVVESADGRTASGTAAVLNVEVGLAGLNIADLDLFPFAVEAKAPDGGVNCPPGGPGSPDSDGDGLTDDQENTLTHTDPFNPNTDGDCVRDGQEDPDADVLTNLDEVNGTKNTFGPNAPTDSTDPDSDNGKIKDGVETGRGTNPNSLADDNPPAGLPVDTDGDGLTDTQETSQTNTSPTNADTDADGVHDGAEDPDGDALSNLEELTGIRNPYGPNTPTNPLDADSDDGGVNDGTEICNFTDPNDGSDDLTPPNPRTIRCRHKAPTILGTKGDDTLIGTPGRDIINGRAGNDTIIGLGGNDWICGRFDEDTIRAGSGNDFILAGTENDRVFGGPGDDRMAGRAGDDRMNGGAGNDGLLGGRGNDSLFGNAGDDRIAGNQGGDHIRGGPGRDQVIGGPGADSVRQ